jgi:hypothetical protein
MTMQSEHKGRGLSKTVWVQPVLFTVVILILIAVCWKYVW